MSTVTALQLRQGQLGGTLEQGHPPCPCGSEMSPPALTHPSHFALSVFIESFIFCISTHRNVPVWVFFFFPLFKINLERVLLPKAGSHPSRCSADLGEDGRHPGAWVWVSRRFRGAL